MWIDIVQIELSFVLNCFRNHFDCASSHQRRDFGLFHHFFNHTFHIFVRIIKNSCFDLLCFSHVKHSCNRTKIFTPQADTSHL